MKPGKGLRRTGFTNRGKPLRRYVGLDRSSKSRAGSGTTGEGGSVVSSAGRPRVARRMPVDVAAVVKARAGGKCEVAVVLCRGNPTQLHHRITQKMGGRHGAAKKRSDRPSNLLFVCDFCHAIVTDHVWVDPYAVGWSLRERQEPTAEPVLYRGDLVYLDDAGEIHSFAEAGA
jgi:hypothetical protein